MRTNSVNYFGVGFCLFAPLAGFALCLLALNFVCSQDNAMLSGFGTNLRALPNGANNNPNTADSQKNSRAGIEQLKTNMVCLHIQTGVSGDSKNKKTIAEINYAKTSSNACNLESIMQNQSEIRICLIIHITNDVALTPNDPSSGTREDKP